MILHWQISNLNITVWPPLFWSIWSQGPDFSHIFASADLASGQSSGQYYVHCTTEIQLAKVFPEENIGKTWASLIKCWSWRSVGSLTTTGSSLPSRDCTYLADCADLCCRQTGTPLHWQCGDVSTLEWRFAKLIGQKHFDLRCDLLTAPPPLSPTHLSHQGRIEPAPEHWPAPARPATRARQSHPSMYWMHTSLYWYVLCLYFVCIASLLGHNTCKYRLDTFQNTSPIQRICIGMYYNTCQYIPACMGMYNAGIW